MKFRVTLTLILAMGCQSPDQSADQRAASAECEACDGTGLCARCDDYAKCTVCDGSHDCAKCNATGKSGGTTCAACDGTKECPNCSLMGVVYNCPHCKGTCTCQECAGAAK